MLGRDSSKNTPQVPHGFNSYINSEEEGVIAGILCDMAFSQMAYGQPVETCYCQEYTKGPNPVISLPSVNF